MQDINITNDNVKGKCDLKCSYNFKYSDSNTTATNDGVMISLTYENSGVQPVLYNNQKYNVTKVYITSPSIHLFDGSLTDAEICIEHTPIKGGSLLSVGIPIKSSSESSTASLYLTEIINGVANNAPSEGDSTTLNINNFSLQQIVPNKPFFSYTDADNNTDWIVFSGFESIPLSSGLLTTLGKIIKPFTLPMMGGNIFFNSSGPNSVSIGDGIYIKCNPTGSSSDETTVEYAKNTTSNDWSKILENPVTQIILKGLLIFIITLLIFYGISLGYNKYFIGEGVKNNMNMFDNNFGIEIPLLNKK
jgi:carbonic anhydrase